MLLSFSAFWQKLEDLEREEELREKAGVYNSDSVCMVICVNPAPETSHCGQFSYGMLLWLISMALFSSLARHLAKIWMLLCSVIGGRTGFRGGGNKKKGRRVSEYGRTVQLHYTFTEHLVSPTLGRWLLHIYSNLYGILHTLSMCYWKKSVWLELWLQLVSLCYCIHVWMDLAGNKKNVLLW